MEHSFHAQLEPSSAIVAKISATAPENPFCTVEYMNVRRRLGAVPCALWIANDAGAIASGCLAFLTRGRMNTRVEITSLPVVHDTETFWSGTFNFCRDQGVSVLSANTFASLVPSITESSRRISLKRRSEYRLDLTLPDLSSAMKRRYRRLINQARNRGMILRRKSDREARLLHVELANASLNRRRERGDHIDYGINLEEVNAYIECQAGEILQAVRDGEVLSTLLLARSSKGGYAQSSGTSDNGRRLGASHFLFHEASVMLKSEGGEVFNLGGADESRKGLQEFKLGLGSQRIELESAEFFTGSRLRQLATRAATFLKNFQGTPMGT